MIQFISPILFLLLTYSSDGVNEAKYEVGDIVRCSQFEGGKSYWEGTVVRRIKTIYQVELSTVKTVGQFKIYLNPSSCTGKKRLSYEDGKEYNRTKIWIAESCLD